MTSDHRNDVTNDWPTPKTIALVVAVIIAGGIAATLILWGLIEFGGLLWNDLAELVRGLP